MLLVIAIVMFLVMVIEGAVFILIQVKRS